MASAEKQETQETLLVSPAPAASPSGCLVRAAGGGRSNLGGGRRRRRRPPPTSLVADGHGCDCAIGEDVSGRDTSRPPRLLLQTDETRTAVVLDGGAL